MRARQVKQLQRLGGADDAPLQQREYLEIAAARRSIQDRADLRAELGRTGAGGTGVLLSSQRVALGGTDGAVGQRDLDARDAWLDADQEAKQAQRLDQIVDRRDRR